MENLRLILPEKAFLKSYRSACEEFRKYNVLTYDCHDPKKYHEWKKTIFLEYENHRQGIGLPENFVPSTTFWLVDGKSFIGMGNIRHVLTDRLMEFGGHIGYMIRYSQWNKGYGSLMLSLLLKEAAALGIERALITCNVDNYASARVIEKNGGELWDIHESVIDGEQMIKKRYWVLTNQG